MKKAQASCNENAGQCKQRSVSAPTVITSRFIVCTKQHLKHLLLLDRVNTILLKLLSHFRAFYTYSAEPNLQTEVMRMT